MRIFLILAVLFIPYLSTGQFTLDSIVRYTNSSKEVREKVTSYTYNEDGRVDVRRIFSGNKRFYRVYEFEDDLLTSTLDYEEDLNNLTRVTEMYYDSEGYDTLHLIYTNTDDSLLLTSKTTLEYKDNRLSIRNVYFLDDYTQKMELISQHRYFYDNANQQVFESYLYNAEDDIWTPTGKTVIDYTNFGHVESITYYDIIDQEWVQHSRRQNTYDLDYNVESVNYYGPNNELRYSDEYAYHSDHVVENYILPHGMPQQLGKHIRKSIKGYNYADGEEGSFVEYHYSDLLSGVALINVLPLEIYPNPTSDYLIVPNGDELLVEVVSMTGDLYRRFALEGDKVNVRGLPQGIYHIRTKIGSTSYVNTFVKM